MNEPQYRNKPIGSIDALAKLLGVSSSDLQRVSDQPGRYILPNTPKLKPDGSVRQTYRVHTPLKHIQRRIVEKIFHSVDFPIYLQGSIRSQNGTRDAIENARIHAGQRIVISEDVSNFFPSVSAQIVREMWQHFFNFHPEVAVLLERLSTFDGFLYQGASTSSYIANLAFWDVEPALVNDLRSSGWRYSRYVDDVTVSTSQTVSNSEKRRIISMVYGLFLKKGCKPNRQKHKLYTLREPVMVHNLNTNSGRPTLNKKERSRVRAAVKECCTRYPEECQSAEYLKLFQSTRSRVQRVKRLHNREGSALLMQLLKVRVL